MINLRPFQKRFIAGALKPDIDTACLSLPRGNGKSHLAAHLLVRAMTPGDELHVPGAEVLLGAASTEQARHTYRPVRADLEPTGHYRFIDSVTRLGITDKRDGTRLRVISSSAKRAMGVVGMPLWVMDEPGSFETTGGQLMHDAAMTAQGKPDSPLRLIFIGTVAPSVSGWWADMIAAGSHGTVYVQALQGNIDRWASWHEIRRCNPLVEISADFREKLLAERDAARADSRLKARFLSYRLNLPSQDESVMLLNLDDWERACARPVALPIRAPYVCLDLGSSRSWSAAVGVHDNGLVKALAVAPGVPSIRDQERRDRVPANAYQMLIENGSLIVDPDVRVVRPGYVVEQVIRRWGRPAGFTADRFRVPELVDVAQGIPVNTRMTRWSESTQDIGALRRGIKDGPLTIEHGSRALIGASLAAAMVKNDSAGNVRLIKRGTNNQARDDVCAALILSGGVFSRYMRMLAA